MRWSITILGAALALGACTAGIARHASPQTSTWLYPADAASNLIAGAPLYLRTYSDGTASLLKQDGRVIALAEYKDSHADLVEGPGGALAQAMGFFGDESATLFVATPALNTGAPFLCGAEGPAFVGYHRNASDEVMLVGMRSGFEFLTAGDGSIYVAPYSPSEICGRLKLSALDVQ